MFFVIITVIRICILNSKHWRMVFLRSSLSSESDITFHNVLIQVNWTIVLKDTETSDQFFFCFFSLGAVCVCECIFAGPDFLKVFAHMLFLTVSFLHVQSHVLLYTDIVTFKQRELYEQAPYTVIIFSQQT